MRSIFCFLKTSSSETAVFRQSRPEAVVAVAAVAAVVAVAVGEGRSCVVAAASATEQC